jgi:hypothetical protein
MTYAIAHSIAKYMQHAVHTIAEKYEKESAILLKISAVTVVASEIFSFNALAATCKNIVSLAQRYPQICDTTMIQEIPTMIEGMLGLGIRIPIAGSVSLPFPLSLFLIDRKASSASQLLSYAHSTHYMHRYSNLVCRFAFQITCMTAILLTALAILRRISVSRSGQEVPRNDWESWTLRKIPTAVKILVIYEILSYIRNYT